MVVGIGNGMLSDNPIILDYICNNIHSDMNLTQLDIDAYSTFLTEGSFSLESIILFETQSLINSNLSDDFYKNIAYLKYSLKFNDDFAIADVGDLAAFEECLNNCITDAMDEIFLYGNPVDKLAFIAGLPASFAWTVASCSYDCSLVDRGGNDDQVSGLTHTPCH